MGLVGLNIFFLCVACPDLGESLFQKKARQVDRRLAFATLMAVVTIITECKKKSQRSHTFFSFMMLV